MVVEEVVAVATLAVVEQRPEQQLVDPSELGDRLWVEEVLPRQEQALPPPQQHVDHLLLLPHEDPKLWRGDPWLEEGWQPPLALQEELQQHSMRQSDYP